MSFFFVTSFVADRRPAAVGPATCFFHPHPHPNGRRVSIGHRCRSPTTSARSVLRLLTLLLPVTLIMPRVVAAVVLLLLLDILRSNLANEEFISIAYADSPTPILLQWVTCPHHNFVQGAPCSTGSANVSSISPHVNRRVADADGAEISEIGAFDEGEGVIMVPRSSSLKPAPDGSRGGRMKAPEANWAYDYENGTSKQLLSFDTCAVVGSAGRLLDREVGEEIDRHSAVFRMNYAPVHGFWKHVGCKTTVRVSYTPHCGLLGFQETAHQICFVHHKKTVNATRLLEVNYEAWRHKAQAMFANVHFRNTTTTPGVQPRMFIITRTSPAIQALERAGLPNPSTGMLAVQIALAACRSVDLYGFSVGESINKTSNGSGKFHYYDELPFLESAKRAHNWTQEHQRHLQLHRRGAVRLH